MIFLAKILKSNGTLFWVGWWWWWWSKGTYLNWLSCMFEMRKHYIVWYFCGVNALAGNLEIKIWNIVLNRCTPVLRWRTILEYVWLLILTLDVDGVRYNLCVVLPLLQTLCGLVVMVISRSLIGVSRQTTLNCVLWETMWFLFCSAYILLLLFLFGNIHNKYMTIIIYIYIHTYIYKCMYVSM